MNKTVRLLNKISYGQIKTYRSGFADILIKKGMAEEITQEEVKPKAKKKK